MGFIPSNVFTETLERAKTGDSQASQELLAHHCKVWTYEELKALNTYRKGKDLPLGEKRNSGDTFYVKKDFQSKPEIVRGEWYQAFDNEYDLYMLIFSDGTKQLWMLIDRRPICNVTEWSDRNIKEEGKPKTQKEKRLSKVFIKPNYQPWNRRG